MTFPSCGHEASVAKSYIDCWPIYARHVVCVKFPFVMPMLRKALPQHPCCSILCHLLTHTHTHTLIHSHSLSHLISSHSMTHSLAAALRVADWLRSRHSLLHGHAQRVLRLGGVACSNFVVTCAKVSPECAQISPAAGCVLPCVPLFGCCTFPCPVD